MVRKKAEGEEDLAKKGALFDYSKEELQQKLLFDIADITSDKVWRDAEAEVIESLRDYARSVGNGKGLSRKLFAEDAEQGFAFIDLCRQKFDVVLMNPPFGDASIPSKSYIDETYGDTRGDVYKAFVECFQDRLVPGGFLGIISSRTGFFLSGSSDWRERIVLRLYRPLVLADFGMGVLDAMVETAAYVLRSLTSEEDRQLTLQLAKDLEQVPTDKKDLFSTKKYEMTRDLKRHQANGELRRLDDAGFIKLVEGHFPRWSPLHGEIAKAPAPSCFPYPPLICLRLLSEDDKGSALYEALHHSPNLRRFTVSPEDFRRVPDAPFCYWVSNNIRDLFTELPPVERDGRIVRHGLSTKDDFRFIRLWWESSSRELCPPESHPALKQGAYCVIDGRRWFPFVKGGAYSPYYSDVYLLIDWGRDGKELKQFADRRTREIFGTSSWSRWINSWEHFFRAGLTWPRRTDGLSFRVLPKGCVFSDKGAATLVADDSASLLLKLCALMNSQPFGLLVSVQLARTELAQSYEIGLIQQTPVPENDSKDDLYLTHLANQALLLKRAIDTSTETSHVFHLPALLQMSGGRVAERIAVWEARVSEAEQQLAAHQREIDDIAFRLYRISDQDRRAIEAPVSHQPSPATDSEQAEAGDEVEDGQTFTDHQKLTADFISYAVGCAFGRWDARLATGERSAAELPDPFAPLPVCAPGALTGEDGLPLNEAPEGYPLRVDADGILVDDPTHPDDIIARAREVFELIWPKTAEAREREASELLGVKDLRGYFRKPAGGGFWTDHVKRYSKSRRKAPIYWLLRSSKGNYSLWLYYHRLDKDILYKALLSYVGPKIQMEENNLAELRSQRENAGTAGREAKLVEKQFDKQESFLSELLDFRDKLKRAADFHLEPDLNDGVVLNIAPLWELVPWTEAKKYWNELLDGKYEWSSISKQLRAKGLVKS